jgi:pectinesterase
MERRFAPRGLMRALTLALVTAFAFLPAVAMAATLTVAADGSAAYRTLGAAIEALPADGGEIRLKPGEYREKLRIEKPDVRLIGLGKKPEDVVLVWGDSSAMAGGTGKSASITVVADGFVAHNLTIQNDYSKKSSVPSQAVALYVTGDRAVFDTVRFLGAQDTLYAASNCRPNGSPTCHDSRQYFRNCYVEGHVDFIFGDARAFFDRCHIHTLANAGGAMITAHSRSVAAQKSGYVFDHATITAEPGTYPIWLGRAWRDYATVIFLDTDIRAPLQPQGWREWTPGKSETFKTATYAERGSHGPGAGNPSDRASVTKQLTAEEAKAWSKEALLSSPDGWAPWKMRF